MSKTIFLLGAGASVADGGPLQHQIFAGAFSLLSQKNLHPRYSRLAQFLMRHFWINTDQPSSLESAFSLIEYFIREQESLGPELEVVDFLELRESLVQVIHQSIASATPRTGGTYTAFWERYSAAGSKASIITTNYDCLLEDAFDPFFPSMLIDYCIPLINYGPALPDPFDWWVNPRTQEAVQGETPHSVKLIKLHGSLNWKQCGTCLQTLLTAWDTTADLATGQFRSRGRPGPDPEASRTLRCPFDATSLRTSIIPPSHAKSPTPLFYKLLCQEALAELRDAERLVVIGYSLPEADAHIRALLLKGLSATARVIVIDPYITARTREVFSRIAGPSRFIESDFSSALRNPDIVEEMFTTHRTSASRGLP